MKTLRCLFAAIILSCAVLIQPAVFTACSSTPQRQAYTTIHSVAKAVDLAEREYLDLVVTKKIGTNNFPRIQAGYAEFQRMLKLTLDVSMGDTNAPPPAGLTANAGLFINDVNKAKENK